METFTTISPILGLCFFVVFFVGVVAWLLRPGARERYTRLGNIPLEENTHDTSR